MFHKHAPPQTIFAGEFTSGNLEEVTEETPEIFTDDNQEVTEETEDELSVVLPTKNVPSITVSREDDWRGFKIEGVLDFSLVGILAKIVSLLAAATISIFAISTYNTDYILVKRHDFDAAADILKQNGYQVA